MAAALAFYTLLSMAPALYVAVGIAGFVFGRTSAREEVLGMVGRVAGWNMEVVVGGVLNRIEADNSVATALGLISIFFGATIVFVALHNSLNRIWNVKPPERGILRDFFQNRLVSFVVVLCVGVVLVLSLFAGAAIAIVGELLPYKLPLPAGLLQLFDTLFSMVLMTLLFAALYRFLPDVHVAWEDVWVGATVTSILFSLGKTAIALYLGHTTLSSLYGTAGSLVIFLLWVYYSAQIFFFGAEFTEVYARRPKHHLDAWR